MKPKAPSRSAVDEHRDIEAVLRKSAEKYRLLAENSLTGVFIHQNDRYVFVNERFAQIHGYSPSELIGRPYQSLVHPADREQVARIASKRKEGAPLPDRYAVRRLKRDGQTIWCEMMATIVEYRGKAATMGNIIDITKRKRSEEKLLVYQQQLRSLASALSLAEERERRRFAIALHDRIGQSLAMIKIRLKALQEALTDGDQAGDIDPIFQLLEETLQATRSLTREMSPHILYELGFVPAIEWLAERFQRQSGMPVGFRVKGRIKPLHNDIGFLLFRAVKELLVNVGKHANARRIDISIACPGGSVVVTVADDGHGFKAEPAGADLDLTGGFGLFSIRERLEHFGGRMAIASRPDYGTRITLQMPLWAQSMAERNGSHGDQDTHRR